MPARRSFGTEISGKTVRGPNLTPLQRQAIIAKSKAGVSVRELVREFGRSPNCIRTTIRTAKKRTTTEEAPRSGRPPVLSLRAKKIVGRKARAAPKIEYGNLAQSGVCVDSEGTPSKTPSRSTLYRALKSLGITNHRCKKRALLKKDEGIVGVPG